MLVVAFIAYMDAGLARNYHNTPPFLGVLTVQLAAMVWCLRAKGDLPVLLAFFAAILPLPAYFIFDSLNLI